MFGLFNNIERDKRIERLEKELELLNTSLNEYAGGQADISTRFLDDLNNVNEVHGAALAAHDERLKRIELLLNEPSSSKQEIVESIITTKAVLKVLSEHGNELSVNSIFDMIKRYNLKNPDVTKDSLRALLYGLRRDGRIDYGKEQGTFKSVPGIYG